MALKVLIAPDKFKGTLTAAEAAAAIARGWHEARPDDALELLPMTDGGDGFGAVISAMMDANVECAETMDAAHRRLRALWWWEPKSKMAIIESANVIGLALMPHGKFHPFELDTFGLGAVIWAAARRGAKRCLIGIGGSATNDAGFGVARVMGWEFLDGAGKPITSWINLDRLAAIRAPYRKQWFEELIVAVDVQNFLLGAHGCSRIYGPQKGLKREDFKHAEKCLRRMSEFAPKGRRNKAGDGAAGGLGFGLRCFLGAKLEPGFELFAQQAELTRRLRGVDLVITGEGAIDRQSAMGKGVGQLAAQCGILKTPCIGLGGTIACLRKQKNFAALHGLTDLTSEKNAKARATFWLERLAEKVAADFSE